MQRRALLSAVGAGTLSLAGCVTRIDSGAATGRSDEPTELPEECPTSQGLDVEWPEDLDASTVESFVEEYEHVYYRDVVVAYEPESQLDSYDLAGSVTEPPREVADGWTLEYRGGGGVYTPTLLLEATASEPPAGTDAVPADEIDDEALIETLEEAADSGEAQLHVDSPGEEVDRYLELLASIAEDFEGPSGPGQSDVLYVDVDETSIALEVTATNFHGDYGWTAWYYVDGRVVRRTNDEDTDPRDGELLECRSPE